MLSAQLILKEGESLSQPQWQSGDITALITEFFEQDDLQQLALDVGIFLDCPLLVLDDAYRVVAHFCPVGFSDPLFRGAVSQGVITYESSSVISRSQALHEGCADMIKLVESPFRRRFAPLICTGVRLGYLICVDTDGHLTKISAEIWRQIDLILAKQLYIETSRQDKPFETTEDILMHLLDGGFPSASYYRLQTVGTYLADFHPSAFALMDLTAYHSQYPRVHHLKEEIDERYPDSHSFLYKSDIFLFLHRDSDVDILIELAKEFDLKVIVSEEIRDLYDLPLLYRAAHDALRMIAGSDYHGENVCYVAQLRTPLLLKNLDSRDDLISPELRVLAEHDRKKGTQYCETLYLYLIYSRSLKKTCDALFTHRNTVLYRIERIRDDFLIPLDDPERHAELLFGVATLLFQKEGPNFFLRTMPQTDDE